MATRDSAEEPEREHAYDRPLCWLIFAAALSAFLGSLTAYHSYDAVAGAVLLYQWIANGSAAQLFHPYHVLYLPMGAAADALLGAAGVELDPLTLLQSLNALFAAGALALFYRLARRLALDPPPSLALTLLLGTGYSYWYYATDAESYAPSLFFLVLAFVSALALRPGAFVGRTLLPGVWIGLAAGLHVTCLLAVPALLLAVRPTGEKRTRRRWVPVALAAAAVTLAPYAVLYTGFEHTDPVSGLLGELRATGDPGYRGTVWWSVGPGNLLREWIGLARAAAPAELPGARSFLGPAAAAIGIGLLALTLLPLVLLLPGGNRRPQAWTLLAWFVPVFVFFSTYNTASEKFASYQWVPLLLLIGLGVRRMTGTRGAHVLAVGALFTVAAATAASSFDLARQRSDPRSNPYLARARAIAEHTGPEDVVIHLGRGENQYQKVYLPYFAVRRSMVLDSYFDKTRRSGEATLSLVDERMREHIGLGRHVFVLADAAEPTASRREFEELHELAPGSLDRMLAEFRPRVAAEGPDLGRLWSLAAPSE